MIRINLLSVREAEREELRAREQRRLVLGAAALAAFLVAVEIGSRLQLRPLHAEHEQLQGEIIRLAAESKELTQLETLQRGLEDKLKTIELLEKRKVGPVQVLADLSDAIPDPVWLLEFTENGGAATITGLALDNQTIAVFMRKLASSDFFGDVDLVETTQSEQEGVPLKKFVIKARLSYVGQPPKTAADPPAEPGRAHKENRA